MSAQSWITTEITADYVHGAVELEATDRGLMPHRLTSPARGQLNGPVDPSVFSDPAGVRLRLRTTAHRVGLSTWPVKVHTPGTAAGPEPVYDIWCDGRLHAQLSAEGGTLITQDEDTGQTLSREETSAAQIQAAGLGSGEKVVEIWLPYRERTELLALHTDKPVEPAPYPHHAVRWLHHGSSISHGEIALGSSHTWPAVAARQLSGTRPVDLVNLGFAGNALLDQFTARTIRDTAADVITLKLGINVVNADSHTLRSFTPAVHGFLDTIREGIHAHTPILVASPLWCGIHEQTPGPVQPYDVMGPHGMHRLFRAEGTAEDLHRGRLNLQLVRTELARIVKLRAQQDPHLRFLDGLQLYGEPDAEQLPLPDALHPDTATHRLIGERFADQLLGSGLLPPSAGRDLPSEEDFCHQRQGQQ